MFCSNCGCEVSENSKFCSRCGTKLSLPASAASVSSVSAGKNVELDREALKQYLYDLRMLEFAKQKLNATITKLESDIKWCGIPAQIQKPQEANSDPLICLAAIVIAGGLIIGGLGELIFDAGSGLMIAGVIIGLVIFSFSIGISDETKAKNMKKYEKAKMTDEQRIKKELALKPKMIEELNNVQLEKEEALSILEEAYSVNIIPSQFRNIYAVYYLYEFVSTSQETLKDALLHFDLDEIKQKLDKVIQNQEQIILNQASLMAQNEHVIEQNNKALRHLAATEQNTALAAQYSQIAATNAEACAWIGVANYIK